MVRVACGGKCRSRSFLLPDVHHRPQKVPLPGEVRYNKALNGRGVITGMSHWGKERQAIHTSPIGKWYGKSEQTIRNHSYTRGYWNTLYWTMPLVVKRAHLLLVSKNFRFSDASSICRCACSSLLFHTSPRSSSMLLSDRATFLEAAVPTSRSARLTTRTASHPSSSTTSSARRLPFGG